MPHFMVNKLSDRLQLINGGKVVYESLYSVDWDQTGLTGTKDEQMRQLEDRVRPVLQRGIEALTPVADMPSDDEVKTNPEKYVKYGEKWPEYIEATDVVSRADTIDIMVMNLDPLEYIPWLGDARVYQTPPSNWWA